MRTLLIPVLVVALLGLGGCSSIPGVTTTQHYNLSQTLDPHGNFLLFWSFNDTAVTFEVHVRTHGFVGFGISGNGQMFPADVITGWVKDGKVYFQDRHTIGHTAPVKDKSQDWHLLQGFENDFGTVLKFSRNIDTCDTEGDIVIQEGTVRLIYSYHPDDPVSEDALIYHGAERRGSKSLSILSESLMPSQFPSDVKYYEFLNNNFMLPGVDTYYLCRGFQMPDIGKHHMIKFEPVITPGNEMHVHHIVVYRCHGIDPKKADGASVPCYNGRPANILPFCSYTVMAWAIGGKEFYFPDHVGFSVGGPDDASFYIMETHYDNPTLKTGVIDNSGMRMTLTSTLRKDEAGMLEIGAQVNYKQVIPPYEPAFISKSYCSESCVRKGLQQKNLTEIRVFAAFQHAHLLGHGIKTRHYRNGVELEPLMNDPNYDFDFQETRALKKERVIRDGDSFSIECTYDSTGRQGPTLGGLSTSDEMCLSFVYYYPRFELSNCISAPTFNMMSLDGLKYFSSIGAVDWTNSSVRASFKQKIDSSSHEEQCIGPSLKPPFSTSVYHPKEPATPYVPPSPQCGTK